MRSPPSRRPARPRAPRCGPRRRRSPCPRRPTPAARPRVYVPIDDGTGSAGGAEPPGADRAPAGAAAPAGFHRAGRSRPAPPASVDLDPLTTTFDDQQQATISYGIGTGSAGVRRPGAGQHGDRHRGRRTCPRGTRIELPIQVIDGDGQDGNAILTVTVTGSTQTAAHRGGSAGRAGPRRGRGGGRPAHRQSRPGRPRADDHRASGSSTAPRVSPPDRRSRAAPCGSPRPPGSSARSWSPPTILDGTKDPDRRSRRTCGSDPGPPVRPGRAGRRAPARSPPAACSWQWAPADANGAPVQTYTVTGGGIAQDCPGADSSLRDRWTDPRPALRLRGDRRATRSAVRPVGAVRGDRAGRRADDARAAVGRSTVARGQLSVSWSVPTGDFTPVTGMSLQVLPGDRWSRYGTTSAARRALRAGLRTGSYQFQVRATNQQGSHRLVGGQRCDRAVRGAERADRAVRPVRL